MIARAQTHLHTATALEGIRAITFDVQGTCVDFFRPILRMGEAVNRHKGLDIDWAALSSDGATSIVWHSTRSSKTSGPWLRVARFYREAFDVLLARRSLPEHFTPPNEMS